MLRPCAFKSVRQKHDQTTQPIPFILCTGDKLVNNHLSRVPEVTKLGLPEDQLVRTVKTVTVIEPKHTRFTERTVNDFYLALIFVKELERTVATTRVRVGKNGMTLTKCSATTILTGKSNSMPFHCKRTKCRQFCRRPIDRTITGRHLAAVLHQSSKFWIEIKSLGNSRDPFNHVANGLCTNAGRFIIR